MTTVTPVMIEALSAIVGPENVITERKQLIKGSQDCYWYSPVLKPLLEEKAADVIVSPANVDEMRQIVMLAVENKIPLILRGAGTGNYGQGVPIYGGILISTRRLNNILEITPDYARVEAGIILKTIELEARKIGAELRFYPSTLPTATAGGFLAGGSGGIGSVTWGSLWDEGNVLSVTIMTVEPEPQLLTITDFEEMKGVVHNCGLTCIIADLTLALAPAEPWEQFVAAFDDFDSALRFGESLAYNEQVTKRLITPIEWPLPGYFQQLVRDGACPEGKSIILLYLVMERAELEQRLAEFGGEITWYSPHENFHTRGWQLSDFSWNHTTLWAMKADEQLTYLQDAFDPQHVHEQIRLRREKYGDDVIHHIEFAKFRGRLGPAGLSIVRFHSKEQLWELIEFCESIGIRVANPHTHRLDEDARWNGQPILDAKARWDPHGLLNPGHLGVLDKAPATKKIHR